MIVEEAEVVGMELIDSGSIVLDYEDPDERVFEEYYQRILNKDEEWFEK